jgi:hypothetical protein
MIDVTVFTASLWIAYALVAASAVYLLVVLLREWWGGNLW